MNAPSPPNGCSTSTEVLLVEDDPLTRERIELLLETAGLGCVSVASVAQARLALESIFFPIVVIDRMLADGDGITLCREVRRHSRDGRTYLMLLSALDSPAELALGLAAGADDYLSKAAADAELLQRLTAASHHTRLPRKP